MVTDDDRWRHKTAPEIVEDHDRCRAWEKTMASGDAGSMACWMALLTGSDLLELAISPCGDSMARDSSLAPATVNEAETGVERLETLPGGLGTV